MKNLFYRFCIWIGYIPTAHLELRAKLLGCTVYSEIDYSYDLDGGYWHTEPASIDNRWRHEITFRSKRDALLYVLKEKGA